MADKAEKTFTLEEAYAELQAQATKQGRCPYCGRRHDSEEAKLFKSLRSDLAAMTEREAKAAAKALAASEERDQLKVRNSDLRAANKELRANA